MILIVETCLLLVFLLLLLLVVARGLLLQEIHGGHHCHTGRQEMERGLPWHFVPVTQHGNLLLLKHLATKHIGEFNQKKSPNIMYHFVSDYIVLG